MNEIAPWLLEAVRLLSLASLKATQEAIELKAPHIPPVLYRYRGTSAWAKSELANGTLSLARPSSFNDPLDSAVAFDGRAGMAAGLAKSAAGGALDALPTARDRIAGGEDPIAVLESLLQQEIGKEHGPEAGLLLEHSRRAICRRQREAVRPRSEWTARCLFLRGRDVDDALGLLR